MRRRKRNLLKSIQFPKKTWEGMEVGMYILKLSWKSNDSFVMGFNRIKRPS